MNHFELLPLIDSALKTRSAIRTKTSKYIHVHTHTCQEPACLQMSNCLRPSGFFVVVFFFISFYFIFLRVTHFALLLHYCRLTILTEISKINVSPENCSGFRGGGNQRSATLGKKEGAHTLQIGSQKPKPWRIAMGLTSSRSTMSLILLPPSQSAFARDANRQVSNLLCQVMRIPLLLMLPPKQALTSLHPKLSLKLSFSFKVCCSD